jgi:hypothetical protein
MPLGTRTTCHLGGDPHHGLHTHNTRCQLASVTPTAAGDPHPYTADGHFTLLSPAPASDGLHSHNARRPLRPPLAAYTRPPCPRHATPSSPGSKPRLAPPPTRQTIHYGQPPLPSMSERAPALAVACSPRSHTCRPAPRADVPAAASLPARASQGRNAAGTSGDTSDYLCHGTTLCTQFPPPPVPDPVDP